MSKRIIFLTEDAAEIVAAREEYSDLDAATIERALDLFIECAGDRILDDILHYIHGNGPFADDWAEALETVKAVSQL